MEFSNPAEEGGPCAWAPDGSLLASCDGNRLFVRDTSTLMLVHIFTNIDTVRRRGPALGRCCWPCSACPRETWCGGSLPPCPRLHGAAAPPRMRASPSCPLTVRS